MAATREKFKNLRCEIDCLAKGYKRAIDELRGPLAKNGFLVQDPNLWAQKKGTSG